MYLPTHFHETRTQVLHELIRAHPLAMLVTLDERGLVANHIPMELDAGAGELGTLRGHVARGNPMWKSHRAEIEAMAVFQGPQSYITPAYYATKAETGKVVPTWNYATVHAYGPLRVIEDAAWLRGLIDQLTDRHEAARVAAVAAGRAGVAGAAGAAPVAWKVSDAPAGYIDGLVKSIVGIEIPLSRIEGKWKMSQNRSTEDRAGVVAGLEASDDPTQRAMAELVRERG
jgi:transcriptional regulator